MRVTLDLTMRSESRGCNRAIDFKQIFGGMFDDLKLKRETPARKPDQKFIKLTDEEKREQVKEVSRKIRESFMQEKVPDRPNSAGLAADWSTGDPVDFGWAISLTDNSPKHFNFESLYCNGQRVAYYNPEDPEMDGSLVGTITEVIFTLGGQVRYSIQCDNGTTLNNIWSGWVSKHCGDHRKEIESTLGRQIIDDANLHCARQLDWSYGDAKHVSDFVITQMATFCQERNVHFAMCPMECYSVFIYLIARQVRHLSSQKERDDHDTGCDNAYAHRL